MPWVDIGGNLMITLGAIGLRKGPGRPKSIPPELFDTILQLYAAGEGYRRIANRLRGLGISATWSSVRRLVKGEGAYAEARVSGNVNERQAAVQRTEGCPIPAKSIPSYGPS